MNRRPLIVVAGVMSSLLAWHCGGSNTPTQPTLTLSSISFPSSSVIGGNTITGTVTLTSAAPSAGAIVALQSSNPQVATVPANVTVSGGASAAVFSVSTTGVASALSVVISASFKGTSRTATLSVTAAGGPVADFTVASTAPITLANGTVLPAGTADVCPLMDPGPALACVFNGSPSTGTSLLSWSWTYVFGTQTNTEERAAPNSSLTPTSQGCGFFGGQNGTTSGGVTFLSMEVRLTVRDATGRVSAAKSNPNVRIFPQKRCGYLF